jgi:DNA-binding NarL/FixJ family response regulator
VTPRETEVLQLASHGLTASDIAEQLVLSTGTVKTHLRNIYCRLGVADKAAAVAAALRHGLID